MLHWLQVEVVVYLKEIRAAELYSDDIDEKDYHVWKLIVNIYSIHLFYSRYNLK